MRACGALAGRRGEWETDGVNGELHFGIPWIIHGKYKPFSVSHRILEPKIRERILDPPPPSSDLKLAGLEPRPN